MRTRQVLFRLFFPLVALTMATVTAAAGPESGGVGTSPVEKASSLPAAATDSTGDVGVLSGRFGLEGVYAPVLTNGFLLESSRSLAPYLASGLVVAAVATPAILISQSGSHRDRAPAISDGFRSVIAPSYLDDPGDGTTNDPPPLDLTPYDPPVIDPLPFEPPVSDPTPYEPPVIDTTPINQPVVDPTPIDPTPIDQPVIDPSPFDVPVSDPTPIDPPVIDLGPTAGQAGPDPSRNSAPIPEGSSAALLLAGLAAMGIFLLKRRA